MKDWLATIRKHNLGPTETERYIILYTYDARVEKLIIIQRLLGLADNWYGFDDIMRAWDLQRLDLNAAIAKHVKPYICK